MADRSKRCINLFYLTKLTETMETTITFCIDVGILPNSVQCSNCKKELVKTYSMARTKAKSDNTCTFATKKFADLEEKKILCHLKLEICLVGDKRYTHATDVSHHCKSKHPNT